MIPTNTHLSIRPNKAVKIPAYDRLSEGCDPALCDEASGIAELDHRRHGGGSVAAVALLSAAFATGMLAGALIVFGLVVIFTK